MNISPLRQIRHESHPQLTAKMAREAARRQSSFGDALASSTAASSPSVPPANTTGVPTWNTNANSDVTGLARAAAVVQNPNPNSAVARAASAIVSPPSSPQQVFPALPAFVPVAGAEATGWSGWDTQSFQGGVYSLTPHITNFDLYRRFYS